MSKTQKALQWMLDIAADNSHGYSQVNRWGPDYDCSSMVIQAWENAGVPVKSAGATYIFLPEESHGQRSLLAYSP